MLKDKLLAEGLAVYSKLGAVAAIKYLTTPRPVDGYVHPKAFFTQQEAVELLAVFDNKLESL